MAPLRRLGSGRLAAERKSRERSGGRRQKLAGRGGPGTARKRPYAALERGLRGFGHLAAADAAGADLEGLAGLADERMHDLEVRLPGALRLVVGVRDVVADATALVT